MRRNASAGLASSAATSSPASLELAAGATWLTSPMSSASSAPNARPAAGSARRAGARPGAGEGASSRLPVRGPGRRTASRSGRVVRDHEIAMEQHRRADADAIAMDGGDDRDFAFGQRAQKAPHRDLVAVARSASRKSARSLPAAKSWPSPRMVMSRTESPAALSIASARAAYIATVIALRRSGRARVIASTPPSRFDPHMLAHSCPARIGDVRGPPAIAGPFTKVGAAQIMKFFADTAEIDEIRELADTGLLDGVTTNPQPGPQIGPRLPRGGARDRRRFRAGLGRGGRARL